MKKILTSALALIAIIIATFFLASCGTTTVIKEVAATTTVAETPVAPATNKYDNYYEHVLNNSGQANSMSKSDVIELGDLICQRLDQGYKINAIVQVVTNASSTTSDMELGAAAIYGAIHYICPEYISDLNNYLSNSN